MNISKGECDYLRSIITNNIIGRGLEATVFATMNPDDKTPNDKLCIKRYKITTKPNIGRWTSGPPKMRGGNNNLNALIDKLRIYNLLYRRGVGVKIHEHFVCDGYFYILMDRINGVTLQDSNMIESNKNKIKKKFNNILSQLGIVFNHESNMHNGNIMIDKNQKPYVIDW
jgi:hypothetical protein